jgi:hypothetical protein
MCKKLLVLLLVLGLASAASALPAEDFEAKTIGALDGQGGGTDFTNNWYGESTAVAVDSETSNQFLRFSPDTADLGSYRLFTPMAADTQYTIYMKFRSSQKAGNGSDEWSTNTPSSVQLRKDGGADPLHLKINQSSFFYLNDGGVMGADDVPDEYTAGTYGGVGYDDYFQNYVDNWAPWKFELDLGAQTVDWYWMDNSGNWDLVASRGMGGAGDVTGVEIDRIYFGGKCNVNGVTIDYDDFLITPEPATMLLLGLGGLALIRKKR